MMKKKAFIVWTVIFLIGMAGCVAEFQGFLEDEKEERSSETFSPPKDEPAPEEEPAPAPEEKEEKETGSTFSPDEYRDFLQGQLSGQVTYSPEYKAFIIHDDDPKLAEEIAATHAGLISPDAWNGFVDSFIKVSEDTDELVEGSGYSLWYANPMDPSLFLVVVKDGILVFDEITGYEAEGTGDDF